MLNETFSVISKKQMWLFKGIFQHYGYSYSSIWSCFCHALPFQALPARYVSHGSIRLLHKKCNLTPIQTTLKHCRLHKTLLLETWNAWNSWLLEWKKSIFQSFNILESQLKKSKDVWNSSFKSFPILNFTYLTNAKRASPLPKSLLHKDHKVNGNLGTKPFLHRGHSIWVHHISRAEALLYYSTTLLAYTILL